MTAKPSLAWRLAIIGLVTALAICKIRAGEVGPIQVELPARHLWAGEHVHLTVRVLGLDLGRGDRVSLRWESVLWGAVLAGGERQLAPSPEAGAQIAIGFEAPRVRHTSTAELRLALLRGPNVVATETTSLTIYPTWDPQPLQQLLRDKHVGLADPSGRLARVLRAHGLPGDDLPTAEAVRAFQGDAIVLGPGASQTPALTESVLEAVESGLSAIWLEPADTSRWQARFGLPKAGQASAFGQTILASEHPALYGIASDDLVSWRGESGPSFVMAAPDGGNWRGLAAAKAEKPGFSVIELFPGAGRIVLCQLPVVSRFDSEPAARPVLEAMIRYALNEIEQFRPAVLWAPPEHGLRLLAEKAGAEVIEGKPPPEAVLIVAADAEATRYASTREPSLTDGIRAHLTAGGKCLFIGGEPASMPFLERCGVRALQFMPAPDKPDFAPQAVPLAWGVSADDLSAAAQAGEHSSLFQYTAASSSDAKVAAAPGAIVKAPVGAGEAILCQFALDRAPEAQASIALFRQLLTNLGVRLKREDQP